MCARGWISTDMWSKCAKFSGFLEQMRKISRPRQTREMSELCKSILPTQILHGARGLLERHASMRLRTKTEALLRPPTTIMPQLYRAD